LAKTSSLSGKELSYNNLLDAHAAICALRNLTDHQSDHKIAALVVKHCIPCGAAFSDTAHESLAKAITSDPKSAFGGIVALSAPCDLACVHALADGYFEMIIAPDFASEAMALLEMRKNLRLLKLPNLIGGSLPAKNMRTIIGGILRQDSDVAIVDRKMWTIPTTTKPRESEMDALDFAWRAVIGIPSNGISIATADHLLGVGAGQPNRIQSMEIAIAGARARGFSLHDAALASDGFFPFDDAIKLAHEVGIRLIIQPGGSIKDKQIIDEANRLGVCMAFTHCRHFRH
jgi:phosphoribosylaminoimidazolecarboxamide formyltransferase/IMP cyclohydrolase